MSNEIKANLGLVVRGDVVALKTLVGRLNEVIADVGELEIIFKHVSASKLWIKEGGDQ